MLNAQVKRKAKKKSHEYCLRKPNIYLQEPILIKVAKALHEWGKLRKILMYVMICIPM